MPNTRHRPRERLASSGARVLSASELLALLVGSGSRGCTAREIAHALLRHGEGSVRRLSRADPAELRRVRGVGTAIATRLTAAFELGRRAAAEDPPVPEPIRGPADVFARTAPVLGPLRQEEFHALLLDTKHRVVRDVLVTRGLLDASLIHPREVFRAAILESASAVILVHNHPSGDPTPSAEDRAVTRQLVEAGRAVGIPVLDHVVIGEGAWRSAMG